MESNMSDGWHTVNPKITEVIMIVRVRGEVQDDETAVGIVLTNPDGGRREAELVEGPTRIHR